MPERNLSDQGRSSHLHTHTHIYIYIYRERERERERDRQRARALLIQTTEGYGSIPCIEVLNLHAHLIALFFLRPRR
jgi:hypothetical protein